MSKNFHTAKCNLKVEVMSGVHLKASPSHYNSQDLDGIGISYLPPDQQLPNYVLNRRRHAISAGPQSPYLSRPRMKRRGAISYEKSDAAAEYIRYLGKFVRTLSNITSQIIVQILSGMSNSLCKHSHAKYKLDFLS